MIVHHHDPRRQGHGLDLIVRHHHHRGRQAAAELRQFATGAQAQRRIETRQRFVHQQQVGLLDQRPPQRHALLLAAGEFGRALVEEGFDGEDSGDIGNAGGDFIGGDAHIAQAESQIFTDRHMGIEGVILEHHGDATVAGRFVVDGAAIQPDFAAIDRFQSGDQAQQGGLAAAGRPEDNEEFAALDGQRKVLENADIVIRLDDMAKLKPLTVRTHSALYPPLLSRA